MEKLLFIDDDLDFLKAIGFISPERGYKVYQCSSPKGSLGTSSKYSL